MASTRYGDKSGYYYLIFIFFLLTSNSQGFGSIGIQCQPMENPQLRHFHKMTRDLVLTFLCLYGHPSQDLHFCVLHRPVSWSITLKLFPRPTAFSKKMMSSCPLISTALPMMALLHLGNVCARCD